MRKITQDAIDAFNSQRPFKRNNTEVRIENSESHMLLHGNTIAISDGPRVLITHGGWPTPTTKERLNGITGVNIHQKDFQWYLNGEAWNGGFIMVFPDGSLM